MNEKHLSNTEEKTRIFTITNLDEVKALLQVGIKPFDLKLRRNNSIRYVYRDEDNAFEIWKNIKRQRQERK